MKKKKICVVLTTRGNYAKMKSIMSHINEENDLELQLIVGGGLLLHKYGNIVDSLNGSNIKIDRFIHFLVEGENLVTMAKSSGLAITEFSTAFENLKPDMVFVIADRFECLAIAMAAVYMNIPVVHIEGGEVSGSIDESIRHAITKLSHIHFPASEEAAFRIERMGEDTSTIFAVGSTSLDVIREMNLDDITPFLELQEKGGVGAFVDLTKPYLLVLQHPVTTEYSDNSKHINETIRAVDEVRMGTIWIWPNMDAGSDGVASAIRTFREKQKPDYIHYFKSLPIELYAPLSKNAACIIGNSSSGIRESSFLGTPSVNIGSRQSGRVRGKNVIDVGYDHEEIKKAIQTQLSNGSYEPEYIYGNGYAGSKIVNILKNFEFNLQKKITY